MNEITQRVEAAIRDLQAGKMVILTDHADRENEGDLIFPAETITADVINFMLRQGSGIVCLSFMEEQAKKLGLNYMVQPMANTSQRGTPFTVSIEAKVGVSTGVSAQDRATTILTAVKQDATANDLCTPGHVFPLIAKNHGVLERTGHTEGSVDLVRLAGFSAAAVICEVMNADGSMAKGKELYQFAEQHGLNTLSIDDLILYRLQHENMIAEEVTAQLPIEPHGVFEVTVIKEKVTGKEHIILENKQYTDRPLVRIHSSCTTGDIFGSARCDCNKQLQYALQQVGQVGGLIIYLNQEGRGIGLFNKIKAYHLQDRGLDTVEANQQLGLPIDAREYYIAANVLRNKNLQHIALLTNNPEKVENLKKYGIKYIERVAMPVFSNMQNKKYLQTKVEKLNHLINCETLG